MTRADGERLRDVLEAIRKISEFSGLFERGLAEELPEDLVSHAILYNLAVVGEAVNHLPNEVKREFPNIAWRDIVGLRKVIAHEYLRIDSETVEEILRADLAALEAAAREALKRGDPR